MLASENSYKIKMDAMDSSEAVVQKCTPENVCQTENVETQSGLTNEIESNLTGKSSQACDVDNLDQIAKEINGNKLKNYSCDSEMSDNSGQLTGVLKENVKCAKLFDSEKAPFPESKFEAYKLRSNVETENLVRELKEKYEQELQYQKTKFNEDMKKKMIWLEEKYISQSTEINNKCVKEIQDLKDSHEENAFRLAKEYEKVIKNMELKLADMTSEAQAIKKKLEELNWDLSVKIMGASDAEITKDVSFKTSNRLDYSTCSSEEISPKIFSENFCQTENLEMLDQLTNQIKLKVMLEERLSQRETLSILDQITESSPSSLSDNYFQTEFIDSNKIVEELKQKLKDTDAFYNERLLSSELKFEANNAEWIAKTENLIKELKLKHEQEMLSKETKFDENMKKTILELEEKYMNECAEKNEYLKEIQYLKEVDRKNISILTEEYEKELKNMELILADKTSEIQIMKTELEQYKFSRFSVKTMNELTKENSSETEISNFTDSSVAIPQKCTSENCCQTENTELLIQFSKQMKQKILCVESFSQTEILYTLDQFTPEKNRNTMIDNYCQTEIFDDSELLIEELKKKLKNTEEFYSKKALISESNFKASKSEWSAKTEKMLKELQDNYEQKLLCQELKFDEDMKRKIFELKEKYMSKSTEKNEYLKEIQYLKEAHRKNVSSLTEEYEKEMKIMGLILADKTSEMQAIRIELEQSKLDMCSIKMVNELAKKNSSKTGSSDNLPDLSESTSQKFTSESFYCQTEDIEILDQSTKLSRQSRLIDNYCQTENLDDSRQFIEELQQKLKDAEEFYRESALIAESNFEARKSEWNSMTENLVRKLEDKYEQELLYQETKFDEDMKKKIFETKEKYMKQFTEKNNEYVKEIEDLKEVHEKNVTRLTEEYKKNIEAMELKSASEKVSLKRELDGNKRELFCLKMKYDSSINVYNEYVKEIEDLKEVHEKNVTRLTEEYKKNIEAMELKYASEKLTLKGELDDNKSELFCLKMKYDSSINEYKRKLKQFREAYVHDKSDLKDKSARIEHLKEKLLEMETRCSLLTKEIHEQEQSRRKECKSIEEINRKLLYELDQKKAKIITLETNNSNLIKEVTKLKEHSFKLLQSGGLKSDFSVEKSEKELLLDHKNRIGKKSSEIRNAATHSGNHVAKSESRQSASSAFKSAAEIPDHEKALCIDGGSGTTSMIQILLLQRENAKKDKEIKVLKKQLIEMTSKKDQHVSHAEEDLKQSIEYNDFSNENVTACSSLHPYPPGAIPKVHPKKALKECNKKLPENLIHDPMKLHLRQKNEVEHDPKFMQVLGDFDLSAPKRKKPHPADILSDDFEPQCKTQ